MLRFGAALVCTFLAASNVNARSSIPTSVGPVQTVFDWSEARCARWDIPDTPARAWRGPDGKVRLVSGSERSRAGIGAELGDVARDCRIIYEGSGADEPGDHDDRAWVHATFAHDDGLIEALAHVEYHGHLRPDRCRLRKYVECWRNSIVQLVSRDGGRTFASSGRADLVAGLPYRYFGEAGARTGYFNPSNVFRRGENVYAFIMAERYRAQRRGPCLIRRPLNGTSKDWRAWGGEGFTIRFADPYREEIAAPEEHVCAPVQGVRSTISGVVWNEAAKRYLAVTPATLPGPDGAPLSGVYWTMSEDLLSWSAPELLWEAPLLWRRDCDAPSAYAYPSLLDEDSASPNFDTVDGDFWLYLVRMRVDAQCEVGPDRDLVRIKVSWPEG